MKFDHLSNPETEEIVNQFIAHVTKTDGDLAEEAKTGKKSSTELKIFIARSNGFNPEDTAEYIANILKSKDTNDNPREFFNEHTFSIEKLNDETYHFIISTPKYNRNDDFILIDSDGYLKAITVIRKSWTEKTIEKFFRYIPTLERLFISSDDLKEVVDKDEDRTLTGFTAKYRPFYKEERVSVQVHGGTDEHLTDVKSTFQAVPKRIEFGQKNSPTDAVKGAIRQDGYASIPYVRSGSEDVGFKTIDSVIDSYEKTDQDKFEVKYRPQRIRPRDLKQTSQVDFTDSTNKDETDGGYPEKLKTIDQSARMEGVTIWIFEEKMGGENYPSNKMVASSLEEEILDHKPRYAYSEIDECNFLVYDRRCGESFEIIVHNQKIRVYAKANTTSRSFRKFYNILDTDFNSTYRFDQKREKLIA
ncbi:hypothetical protein ACFQJC_15040 [Haloferax namakaokahaiae]|uniref:MvaI/BcnI restriction endonuclease domain-containing protein n=1 Tax=Haloferax namakaokahaiae TaxID=1748331 RepID=A0ABD5ZI08_9EURY